MLFERAMTDVLLVAPVADAVAADDDEQDIGVLAVNQSGGAHEDVEPAHRLESAAHIGHDARRLGNFQAPHAARDVRAAMKHLGLDTVEDHFDLGLIHGGEKAFLVMRRAVAQAAVIQVQENHRVARAGAEEVARLRREFGTEVEVRAVRMIVMLEIVHNRHARESLGKIER